MSVLIGHASISEQGTINGTKGDSTSKEVCTRTWYSKPWGYMAIHPNANVRENTPKQLNRHVLIIILVTDRMIGIHYIHRQKR